MHSKLIVAAISARGFAQVAKSCEYQVITLDAFADADTRNVVEQSFKVHFGEQGVDEDDFKRVFSKICLNDVAGLLYGSLFDAAPALLAWVAKRVPIIGNDPETMRFAKSLDFFSLLDNLNIQHPEVQLDLPSNTENWLSKQIGGNGGLHVKPVKYALVGNYFQRHVDGEPISLLFFSDGVTAKVIGFNLQLISPTVELPYRFAGAVSNIALPKQAQQQMIYAAQQLTTELGLRGINSLDAVIEGSNLWVLELNPRLSASFHLYPNLMQTHIQACKGQLLDYQQANDSRAQMTLYAHKTMEIPSDFAWPDWVADIPYIGRDESSVIIRMNDPICSVLAEAGSAAVAHQLVLQRVNTLKGKLLYD